MAAIPRTAILGALAEQDFAGVITWTAENFGARQARAYARLFIETIDKIARDPLASPSRARDEEIGAGFRTLHVARPGRHLVLYRLRGADEVLIVRILHDSMELARWAGE